MTDLVKLDLDPTALVRGVDIAEKALDRLENAVGDLAKQTGTQLSAADKVYTKHAQVSLTASETMSEAVNKMRWNMQHSANLTLNAVSGMRAAVQQQYEKVAVLSAGLNKRISDDEVRMYSAQGARLTQAHKAQLRQLQQQDKLLEAWLKAKDARPAARDNETLAEGRASLNAALQAMEERSAARKVAYSEELAQSRAAGSSLLKEQRSQAAARVAVAKEAADAEMAVEKAHAAQRLMYTKLWVEMEAKERKAAAAAEAAELAAAQKMKLSVLNQRIQEAKLASRAGINTTPYVAAPPLSPVMQANKKSVDELSGSFRKMTVDGNDMHSMARGLASGFNLLWLTWGNLAPLFIGAAISNGFMQTAKQGMEVAHTMAIIANLGGNTATEMSALTAELDRLGKSGPVGPKDVADAMKTLALAGLNANEILGVTQDVLNFSVAGTTDLKTAADTLVSVSTAFGMGAEGFGRVADVIAKTASVSKSSVESISESMKTASVINAQYGVSLEDTATALAALSQLGIEGSAAGTALRNMYADLSGRSQAVAKALKSQGIEMRNASGGFRPMIEVVAELNNKFLKLDGISQKNLMQTLLSERGAKGIVEMLRLINSEAKNAGAGMSNALEEMRSAIENSYGFAAIQAAEMAQTTQNQFKAVSATLGTAMQQAYREMEPALVLIADALRNAFGSPGFLTALTTMVNMVARFSVTVLDNMGVIQAAAAAYVAWRVVMWSLTTVTGSAVGALLGLTSATAADTIAANANAAARARANVATATLGRSIPVVGSAMAGLARFLPVVGQAIAVGSTAWMIYDMYMGKAKDTALEADKVYNNNVVSNLRDEADRLERLNALRAEGLSLQEAEARMRGESDKKSGSKSVEDSAKTYQDLKTKYDAQQERILRIRKQPGATQLDIAQATKGGVTPDQLARAKAAKDEAFNTYFDGQVDREVEAGRIRAARMLESERDKAAAEAERKAFEAKFGNGTFGGAGSVKSAGAERAEENEARRASDKALQAVEQQVALRERTLKHSYDTEQAVLDVYHRNKLISEGEYQATSLANTLRYEAETSAAREQAYQDYLAEVIRRRDEISKTMSGKEALAAQKELDNQFDAYLDKRESLATAQRETAEKRRATAMANSLGELRTLQMEMAEFWAEDAIAQAKNSSSVVASLNEYEKAAQEAGAAATAKYALKLRELEVAALSAAAAVDVLTRRADSEGGQELLKALEVAKAKLKGIQDLQESAKSQAVKGTEAAERTAMDKVAKDAAAKFMSRIAGAVETGLKQGGEAGATELRNILEEELLSKPFKVFVEGVFSGASGSGGGGGLGSFMQMFNTGASGAGSWLGNFLTDGKGIGGLSKWFNKGAFGDSMVQAISEAGGGIMNFAASSYAEMLPDAWRESASEFGKAIYDFGGTEGLSGYFESATEYLGYFTAAMKASEGKWGAAIGTAVGTWFGGIWGAVGNIVGTWVDNIFSGGSESTTGRGLEGTFSGSSFSGNTWQTWYNPGSWWGQSSNGRNTRALDSTFTNSLGQAFGMSKLQTLGFAGALGAGATEAGKVMNYSRYMNISTEGGPDATRAAIEGVLAAISNELASFIISNKFQKSGEALSATLARLATNLVSVNSIFKLLGKATLTLSEESGGAASALIEAFGSLEDFTAASKNYYELFYSEEEKRAATVTRLQEEFAKFGMSMPSTKEGFRALVNAQDVTTAAGRAAYVALMTMAGAFAEVTESANAAKKALTENDFASKVAWQRYESLRINAGLNMAAAMAGGSSGGGAVGGSYVAPVPQVVAAAAPVYEVGSVAGALMGYAEGGTHSGGWRVVGERGPELEYTGPSQIFSHENSLFDTAPIVDELRALRTEVANLRFETRAIAVNTGKVARIEDKWDNDGMPKERV